MWELLAMTKPTLRAVERAFDKEWLKKEIRRALEFKKLFEEAKREVLEELGKEGEEQSPELFTLLTYFAVLALIDRVSDLSDEVSGLSDKVSNLSSKFNWLLGAFAVLIPLLIAIAIKVFTG